MNAKTLRDEAMKALGGRSVWEQKQQLFYRMRHEGIRRTNKPFPRAADFHLPVVDSAIGKQKPFWYGQGANNDRLAIFLAKRNQPSLLSESVAEYFDYVLRYESCFLDELTTAIDFMLLRGRGVLKATVDPFDGYRLMFEAVDPLYILMAEGANDFEDADWFVQIKHVTLAAYKRDRRYNQAPDVIRRIQGGDAEGLENQEVEKETREGITHSEDVNRIILWEHWVKTPGGWTFHTYSPKAPEAEVKKPVGCPYKTEGKPSLPFFSFPMELKDKGWYAPRGLAEKTAAFETLGCKLMNDFLDGLTFTTKPLFTAEGNIPNQANIRFAPGEFVPGNLKRVDMGAAPMELASVVNLVKGISEELIQTPDFGVTQDGQPNGKPRTATENQRISQLQDVGTSFNGELFRRRLQRLYRHCWGLRLQFKPEDLSYLAGNEFKQLPPEALHEAYLLTPGGRSDMWNRAQNFNRAVARLQLFQGAPNVNQDELVKDVIAADDAAKVRTLFVPSGVKAASEAEDEAQEISILTEGFPAAVRPDEDHFSRAMTLLQWLDAQHLQGLAVNPLAQQRVMQHLAQHVELLKKANPQQHQELMMAVQQMEQQQLAEAQPAPTAEGPMEQAI